MPLLKISYCFKNLSSTITVFQLTQDHRNFKATSLNLLVLCHPFVKSQREGKHNTFIVLRQVQITNALSVTISKKKLHELYSLSSVFQTGMYLNILKNKELYHWTRFMISLSFISTFSTLCSTIQFNIFLEL